MFDHLFNYFLRQNYKSGIIMLQTINNLKVFNEL